MRQKAFLKTLAVILTTLLILPVSRSLAAVAPNVSSLNSLREGITSPVRLANDIYGNLYVTDPRGGGVLKLSNSGKLLKKISLAKRPFGIAVTTTNKILVSQLTYISVLDGDGTELQKFGTFKKANGITVDATGALFVTDSQDNCVQVFNADFTPRSTGVAVSGKPDNSFGGDGKGEGQFLQPTGISYESAAKQLAVVDSLNGRVEFFSTTGTYQKSIGSFGSGALKFTLPQAVAFEYASDLSLSRMYVLDAYQSTIQTIDPTGPTFLRYVGSYGLGSDKLIAPYDVLYDRSDSQNRRLIVANGNGAIALYGVTDPPSFIKTTGPTLTINTLPLVTNLTTLTISGTVTSTKNITGVVVNGINATITSGIWSATIPLEVGDNAIKITATNTVASTVKNAIITVLPQEASKTPVTLTLDPTTRLTKSSTFIVSGTVTSGATVTVNGTAATVTNSNWNRTVPLTEGINTFSVVGSKEGLSDTTTSFNITLDSIPPKLKVSFIANGSSVTNPVQTISGTVEDANTAAVTVSINGTAKVISVSDGSFCDALLLAAGSNTVTIVATDGAGNDSAETISRTVTYDPSLPVLTIDNTTGEVVGVATTTAHSITGTATVGYSVFVNGLPASKVTAKTVTADTYSTASTYRWAKDLTLIPGVNNIQITMREDVITPAEKKVDLFSSVVYHAELPSLIVKEPKKDMATAKSTMNVVGESVNNVSVTATVNGVAVPVATTAADGKITYGLTLPRFSTKGNYTVVINATDSSGATSTVTRTVLYDPTVPDITVVTAKPLVVTCKNETGRQLLATDKNGLVRRGVPGSDGLLTLNLSGDSYDAASLNIRSLTEAGVSSRDGILTKNSDGTAKDTPTIHDVVKAARILAGLEAPATTEQMLHIDIAPVLDGEATSDGKLTIGDIMAVLRKVIGL